MNVAAVIINYRTPELTAKVTTALLPELAGVGGFHVYVIDNCSGDGSVERLRASAATDGWGDRVTVVAAPRNGGYGYGINLGVELARKSGDPPKYIFVLNSDAFADPGAVHTLVAFMDAHPDVGLAGANIHGTDGEYQGSAFRFPSAATELNHTAGTALIDWLVSNATTSLPLPTEPQEVDWISGTAMMIRHELFERIGWFDEGFFLYFEEVDFCQRARRAGYRSYSVPAAAITHLGSVSTGVGNRARRMPGYWFESRHRYLQKHHGRGYTALCDASWAAGFVIAEAKRAVLRRPPTRPPEMFRDFLRHGIRQLLAPKVPGADDVVHATPNADDGVDAGSKAEPAVADARPSDALGMLELVAEDFATYDRKVLEPGLWAVITHRIGRRAGSQPAAARLAMDAAYKVLFTGIDWVWGIHLPRSVELGRRVRIWHNGCMLLTARSIGNDVHIRHDTTFAPLRGTDAGPETLPVIEDRADLGSGICVLGGVRVGHDAHVGANSVVMKDVLPHATVLGVPARTVPT